MGDNTKFVLHVDDNGNVVKAEKEDSEGNRSDVGGNWSDLQVSSDSVKSGSSVMNWVGAPQPEEEETDSTSAPKV